MANAAAGLPPACTAAVGYKCLFAPYVVPYLSTPIFAINSKFDASMAVCSVFVVLPPFFPLSFPALFIVLASLLAFSA